ncbi:MAG: hypothetical protein J5992_09200, partial [Oscillospiraceae bacterium]|nr:hypothetical protein [Oscillospiraceae bacterium]
MTSKNIEELATTAVKRSIITTDHLDQYISENDKKPFVDGEIFIYKTAKKVKKDCVGCVPVQVKGKRMKKIKMSSIKYPVSIDDLRFHLFNGGCIYFVVYISFDGNKSQIYYLSLPPVKIIDILNNNKNTTTIHLKFKPFPTQKEEKENIFLSLAFHCKKQHSFTSANLLTLNSNNDIVTDIFAATGTRTSPKNVIDFLFSDDTYFYGKVSDTLVPFEYISKDSFLLDLENSACNVHTQNNTFYNFISRTISLTTSTLKIGKSFFITIKKEKNEVDYHFKLVNTLNDRIIDLKFLIQIIKENGFYLDDKFIALSISEEIKAKIKKSNIEAQLIELERIKQVLNILNIYEDIDYDALTENELIIFNILTIALIDKKPVPNLKENLPFVQSIKIQNLNLFLTFNNCFENKQTYIIEDFFDLSHQFFCTNEETNEQKITSRYALLNDECYIYGSNLVLNDIIPYYENIITQNPDLVNQLNIDLLNILKAYDKSNNPALLQAAQDIALWLYGNDKFNKKISTINLYQVYRRQRELTPEENKILYKITEDTDSSLTLKVGAHLLSGSIIPAQILFENLSTEEQEEFRK